MKFCRNCGVQLEDATAFCTNCGTACEQAAPQQPAPQQQYAQQPYGYQPAPAHQPSGLATAAKIFMIISTVVMGIYILPLAWCLPMTISYCKKIKTGEPISVAFKICTLLFVNTIGGILMLCDNNQ